MQVNGEQVKLDTPVSVADYLEAHGFRAERVAIELNGEIIPRDKRADAMLDDQCVMEIVHPSQPAHIIAIAVSKPPLPGK